MNRSNAFDAFLARVRGGALAVGCAGALLAGAGYLINRERFFQAYLFAYMFWLGLTLGSMIVVMIHGLTGGGWGLAIRRIVEAGMNTLPLMILLFLPLLLGIETLYDWSHSSVVEHDEVLQAKSAYLNVAGFQIRAAVAFAVWSVSVLLLNRWSLDDNRDPDSPRSVRLQRASGVGLALYGLSITVASVDWVMSLEPHWFSTTYGVLVAAGQGLSGLCFAVVAMTALEPYEPWRRIVDDERRHDLANLLLAFTMFWAYIAFMQFLIIWSGDLPEENVWYLNRSLGGWELIATALMCLAFALPFFLLLLRDVTRRRGRLCLTAGLLLAMQAVNVYWMIEPAFSPGSLAIHWLHFAAFAAVGGFWTAVFCWRLSARAFLPIYDPLLAQEAIDERTSRAAG